YSIRVRATDQGGLFFEKVFTINVTNLNEAPVLDLNGSAAGADFAATYNDRGAAVAITAGTSTLLDADGTLSSLTVQITNIKDPGLETLDANITAFPALSKSYNPATGILVISGTETSANYQQVLRTITYIDSDLFPRLAARSVTFVANDGTSNSNTATTTV